MKPGEPNRRANIWTARFIPLLLIGIIGYVSWVVTKLVVVDYLLNPSPLLLLRTRTGPAIAIVIVYYLLLMILLVTYGRLIQTIIQNPGLLPRGPQWYIEEERKQRPHRRKWKNEKDSLDSTDNYKPTRPKRKSRFHDDSARIEEFWHKDVFICSYDGRPRFCSSCFNYKLDRVHHCSELDRCVYKMDHFCPWVAGIVSETSFKYFIQFTFWTAWFCLNTLVVMAYYYAERRRREDFINVHWILALAFAALFLVFGAGMCGSSMQFAFENTTTIENLDRRSHVWYLAIYVPPRILQQYLSASRTDLRLITYPRPPAEQLQTLQEHGANVAQQGDTSSQISPPTAAYNPSQAQNNSSVAVPPVPISETRTFAILETYPGENPFNIGLFGNFCEVMGYTIFEWLLPIYPSPCTDHSSPECMYKTGAAVHRLRKEAGIIDLDVKRRHSSRRKKRRRRRRRSDADNTREKPTEAGRE